MATIADVVRVIESFAPVDIQENWDNCGLCAGSPDAELTGVLVGFDCTRALIDEAVECGANMVVTHHPLIFHGLKKVDEKDPVGAALIRAIRSGVAVYCAHTSADKAPGGVSWAIARRLGLENVSVLDYDAAVSSEGFSCGLGIIGDFPEALSSDRAIEKVKEAFGLPYVRCSRPSDGLIRRVAACGGAGSSLVDRARAAGAQLYLCGDVSYHHFFTPEGFMVMDIGHYESEIDIVSILFSLIQKNFPTFAVRIAQQNNNNPVFYF